jgi:hypothetical protein
MGDGRCGDAAADAWARRRGRACMGMRGRACTSARRGWNRSHMAHLVRGGGLARAARAAGAGWRALRGAFPGLLLRPAPAPARAPLNAVFEPRGSRPAVFPRNSASVPLSGRGRSSPPGPGGAFPPFLTAVSGPLRNPAAAQCVCARPLAPFSGFSCLFCTPQTHWAPCDFALFRGCFPCAPFESLTKYSISEYCARRPLVL